MKPIFLTVLLVTTFAIYRKADAEGLSPIKPESIKMSGDVEQVVLAQKVTGDTLTLLPDHCFFSGENKGLHLTGTGAEADPLSLNGGKSFASIDGLNNATQKVVWPLWLRGTGAIEGKVVTRGNGKLKITLGDEEAAGGAAGFKFTRTKEGRVDLVISPDGFCGSIERVELHGPALKNADLLRARWRPLAIHSGFGSSTLGKSESRMWVMEVRPVLGEKGFYGPITTPFGYFGSTFKPDGTSGGINFSMWSFAAGKIAPPLPQLSHLLAVGSPQATFGAFDHEGTGVKLRGWNPYEGVKVNTTALALRIEPGTPYDTYTGYFLDQTTRTWKLYAIGRKWSERRSIENLLPGCFVEVPGPPQSERTGHIAREADFRGWCRDKGGNWHQLDLMRGSQADARREQTNCLWASTPDGWFRMAMGGMTHFRYPKGVDVQVGKVAQLPDYLAPEKLKLLDQIPTDLRITNASRTGGNLVVEIELGTRALKPTTITALYGVSDALSFAEKWGHTRALGEIKPGKQKLTIPAVPVSGFIRLQAANDTGTYITAEAASWK